ncbi:MAG: hypothetical protein Q8942_04645 [Bacillota bacterium]|nr:hypothetical protein [Bacillota bacterium]
MRRTRFNSTMLILLALSFVLTGCSGSVNSIKINRGPQPSKIKTNLTQELKTPQKAFYNNRISENFSKELSGIVYNNYVASDYNLLYGSMGGLELFKICSLLDIKTSIKDEPYDESKPEYKYQGNFVPASFYVEKDKTKLNIKVKGKIDDYFAKTPYPDVQYEIFKNSRLVKGSGIYQYKGQFYLNNLEDFLKALDIKYYIDRSRNLTYVGSSKPTKIIGRLLAMNKIEINHGEKSTVNILYNFDDNKIPNYSDIVLNINGKKNYSCKIYDTNNRGRSDYYYSAILRDFKSGNETFLQVSLSDTPNFSNDDTAIFKLTSSYIVPVFNMEDYEKCLNGNFTLETDTSGNCTFKDKLNNIEKVIDLKIDKSNAVFNIDLREENIELDPSGKMRLLLIFSAIDKINFFHVTIDSEYKNGRFKPVKAIVADKYNHLENPDSLKDPYKIFYQYDLNNMNFNVSGNEVIEKLKSIKINNLNNINNSLVTIELENGYYANESIGEFTQGFSFNAAKNKGIKEYTNFSFYNDKNKDSSNLYGEKGLCGLLEVLGYYREEPLSTIFPNHSMTKSKVYSGMTMLGKADIFILDCDLPRELRTEKRKTYEVIYAWIPIDNEKLAYNLVIAVPFDEKSDNYVAMVKKMLKAF